jgi:hypothetical protein
MQINDILYTPLDVPDKPEFDINKLKSWLSKNHAPLSRYKDTLAGTNNTAENIIENYPWDLTVAYFKLFNENEPGWLGNFDKEFPELSRHMYESFNLSIDDIGLIVFLPIKQGHTGLGFWHNDTDWYGLRHYYSFDNINSNKLLMKKTKLAYTERPYFPLPIDESIYLQEETIECKVLSPTQSFFLNNVRSVHSTYTVTPDVTRIAAFVTGKVGQRETMQQKIESLVIRSAEKYKDYAVLWNDHK